jgi:phosphate transport system substrate-binding protein
MVTINQGFKDGFESQFPGTTVTARATGSREGIAALLRGEADIAASSRPLTETEKSQGLMAMPVATDAIAVVVGGNNPYRRSLTPEQVRQIFQGKITDWSAVGGSAGEIRVINRPPVSGTHQVFRELVLDGAEFGTTPNIAQMDRDATTPLLQGLGTDGIGYATYAQVANQQTVRVVPIAGLTPEAPNYPYQRQLFYVYSYPPTAAVKAFLGYIKSAAGQAIIEDK